jgi:hypothetical protein
MTDKEKREIEEECADLEPFYRKLKQIEGPVNYPYAPAKEADKRLSIELSNMRLQYDNEMRLMQNIVNFRWHHAKEVCVQSLNIIIDRMSTINVERAALVKGRGLIDAMKADDIEPTIRPSFNIALKRYEKHSTAHQQQDRQSRFFRKGGQSPRRKRGFRRNRQKPPWERGGPRKTQREGALNRGPATRRQAPGQPFRGKKKFFNGKRRT